MSIRFIALLVIGTCTLYAAASAANLTVVHITQRDNVYYGDVVDLRGVTGWANTLAWWAPNHAPSQDPPDQYANITKYERFNITSTMKAGMWYQWYGSNEKSPVAVFYVIPKARPVPVTIEPTITPTPAPTPEPRLQPEAVADYLVARWDDFSIELGETVQIWLIGPEAPVIGERDDSLTMLPVEVMPGDYTLTIQHQDGNDLFEIYRDHGYINSIWKGVDPIWIASLSPQVLEDKLDALFGDAERFHGTLERKSIIVGEQTINVGTVEQTPNGIFVSGTTNLRKGENLTVEFGGQMVQATAKGDDPGALRVWRASLNADLNNTPPGEHFVTATPPHGESVTVPVYISERFTPFETPTATLKFINNSPFIPTPTPLIIEKQVQVTVIQTVTIPVTPSDAALLYARQVAENQSRVIFEKNLAMVGIAAVLVYLGYRTTRYMVGVVRRAKAA